MNKLTKLLSVFILAGAVGTGATLASGCAHKHSYSDEWTADGANGHYHAAICEHTDERTETEPHNYGNDDVCDDCDYDKAVHVKSLTLDTEAKELVVGATHKITATVLPANATYTGVTYTSSNTSVATVAADGTVTAVAVGTANITVKSVDEKAAQPGSTKTLKVTVKANTPQTVAVTGVELDQTTLEIKTGETEQLRATVLPKDENGSLATNKNVTWSSDNEAAATVDQSGLVTGVAAGEAVITVTTQDGNKTAQCVVTVTSNTVAVTGVSLNVTTHEMEVEDTYDLNESVTPANATNQHVTWASDNTEVATVSEDGTVTAVKAGTAKITVTTVDGGHTAECTITVKERTSAKVSATGVELSKTTETVKEGATVKLTATVLPKNEQGVSTATNKNVTWSSSDNEIATVSGGTVTGVKAGTATITVTTVDGGYTAECTVTVTTDKVAVTGVTLDKTTLELTLGGANASAQLNHTLQPAGATNKSVTWASSDETVATVSASGLVTGVKAGTAKISVTTADGSFKAECTVTVKDAVQTEPSVTVTSVTVTAAGNKTSIEKDETVQLSAEVVATPDEAANKNVTWSSEDSTIATVSANGLVTGVKAGTVKIYATSTVNSAVKGEISITVTEPAGPVTPGTVAVTGVSLDRETAELTVGGATLTLNATVAPDNATNQSVSWASDDETVATVANGVVTAVGAGTATITVTTADGNHTATCEVTVSEATVAEEKMSEEDYIAAIESSLAGSFNFSAGEAGSYAVDCENNVIYDGMDGVTYYTYDAVSKKAYKYKAYGKDGKVFIKEQHTAYGDEGPIFTFESFDELVNTVSMLKQQFLGYEDYDTEVTFENGAYKIDTVVGWDYNANAPIMGVMSITFVGGKLATYDLSANEQSMGSGTFTYGDVSIDSSVLANAYEPVYDSNDEPNGRLSVNDGLLYGLYAKVDTADDYVEKTEGGFKQTVKQGGSGQSVIISLSALKGNIEGYFEMSYTAEKGGSKWDIIQFISGSEKKFCVNMIDNDGTLKYNLGVTDGDTSNEVANQKAPQTAVVMASGNTVTVKYSLVKDADGGNYKLTLTINDKAFVTDVDLGVSSVERIELPASNISKGPRVLTVNNVLICGETVGVDEIIASAQAQLDGIYNAMVGDSGTHLRNKENIEKQILTGTTFEQVAQGVKQVKSYYASFDSDAAIDAAVTAAKTEIEVYTADEYKNKYTQDSNKQLYDKLFEDADKVLADAVSVEQVKNYVEHFGEMLGYIPTDVQLAAQELQAAKNAAHEQLKETAEAYIATLSNISEVQADKLEAVTATITEAWNTAYNTVESAQSPSEAFGALETLRNAADKAIASGTGNVEGVKTSEANRLAQETSAKITAAGITEESVIALINGAVDTGRQAITAETVTTEEQVAEAYAAAELAIDKIIASAALDVVKANAVSSLVTDFEINGVLLSAICEKVADGSLVKTQKAAIDAAAKNLADYDLSAVKASIEAATAVGDIATLRDTAQGAIATAKEAAEAAIATATGAINGATFTVTIEGVTGITAADVAIGDKVVLAGSEPDNLMVKGWKLGENDYDLDDPVYDNITLTAITAAAIKTDINNAFSYAAIDSKADGFTDREHEGTTAGDSIYLTQSDFNGTANSFLTISGQLVVWRKSNSCIQNKNDGLSFEYAGGGSVTVSIGYSSTGSSNKSRLGLKGPDGKYIVATDNAGLTLINVAEENADYADNGTYETTGTGEKTLKFTITEKGTYTICCPSGITTRGARVYNIKLNGYSKIESVPVTGVEILGTIPGADRALSTTGQSEVTLPISITPANASNQNVTWTSSNPAVATVDQDGMVVAKAQGLVTITVTTEDGNYTASATIDVDGFKQYAGTVAGNIGEYEVEGIKAENEDTLEELRSAAIAKITSDVGDPLNNLLVSTGEELDKIFDNFKAQADALVNSMVTLTLKYHDDLEDREIDSFDVPAGESLSAFAPDATKDPYKKEGYRLEGWYTESSYAEASKFDFATATVEAATELFAKYVKVWTVTFVSGVEDIKVDPQIVDDGERATEPTVSRDGYELTGWYTEGGTKFAFGEVASDLTLTAEWKANKITGSFTPASLNAGTELKDSNSGVVSISTSVKFASKGVTKVTVNDTEFTGNVFRANATDNSVTLTVKATKAAKVTVYASVAKDTNFRDTFETTIKTTSSITANTYEDIITTATAYDSSDKVNRLVLYKIELNMSADETITISWNSTGSKTAVFLVDYEYSA